MALPFSLPPSLASWGCPFLVVLAVPSPRPLRVLLMPVWKSPSLHQEPKGSQRPDTIRAPAGHRSRPRARDDGAAMLSPGTSAFRPLGALFRVRAHLRGAAGRQGPRCARGDALGAPSLYLLLETVWEKEEAKIPVSVCWAHFPVPGPGTGLEGGGGGEVNCLLNESAKQSKKEKLNI